MLDINDLHLYQKATVNHICAMDFCGVFLDMGLGKTVSTLTAIWWLYKTGRIRKVLIVAPKRVAESVWEEETQKWEHLKNLKCSKIIGAPKERVKALQSPYPIHIISRDNISWLNSQIELKIGEFPYDMLVVDELSSFKSAKSVRFKALKAMRPYLRRFVGLTGTPAPNSLLDLWPQIWLIDCGKRLGKNITAYRNRFFKPLKTNGHIVYKWGLREDAEEIIHNSIKDICISMKAEDYLQLPERIDNIITVYMDKEERAKYELLEKQAILSVEIDEETKDITALSAAALTNKLLQLANGSVYTEDGEVVNVHSRKLDALEDIVESANGQPVLVAWTYKFDRDAIMERFKDLEPRELKDNQDIKDWNDGKIKLLLTHPASAGHGLNLQAGGNIIVWYGQTWSLELYQQFNARLHRQGQKKNVIVHHIVCDKTVDGNVIQALQRKTTGQEALMKAVKARIEKYVKLQK